jgi:predicted RNA-binding Zn-ribbon protein involved in translation (DUF1610 family)
MREAKSPFRKSWEHSTKSGHMAAPITITTSSQFPRPAPLLLRGTLVYHLYVLLPLGPGDMVRRRISGRELLRDIRSGMDDAGLMKKYNLSPKGILLLMGKLVSEGRLTPEELASRRSLAKTVYFATFKCPVCQEIHYTRSESCPRCGAAMTQLNK